MTIEYTWDDPEQTVFRITYPGPSWMWNDLRAMQREVNVMLDSHSHFVIVIQDFTEIRSFPTSAFPNMRGLVRNIHPKVKVMVFVGVNQYIRSMWDIFLKLRIDRLVPVRFLFASSVEQGITLGQQALLEIK